MAAHDLASRLAVVCAPQRVLVGGASDSRHSTHSMPLAEVIIRFRPLHRLLLKSALLHLHEINVGARAQVLVELLEVDLSVAVHIKRVEDRVDLGRGPVELQKLHCLTELFSRDGAAPVCVPLRARTPNADRHTIT